MGLFGGSSKSSSNTTNQIENTTLGADGGSIVAENSTINVLDAGAVRNSFLFADNTVKSFESVFESSLFNNSIQNDRAFSFSEGSLESSYSLASKAFDFTNDLTKFTVNALSTVQNDNAKRAEKVELASIASVGEANQSTQSQGIDTIKYVGIGVVLIVAFVVFGKK